jgi:pimeloyl-ACP methyl ester carboxylesterase
MDVTTEIVGGELFALTARTRLPRRGTALMTHGFFSDSVGPHRLGVKIAAVLLAHGFDVVRYDLRGCGHSAGLQRDVTLETQRSDINRMAALVRERSGGDEVLHVALSFGGVALSLYDDLASCSRICLVNVPTDLRVVFARQATLSQRVMMAVAPHVPGVLVSREVLDFEGNELSVGLLQQSLRYDWETQWSRFRGNALLVQADGDELVPPAQAVALRDLLTSNGSSASLVTIAGADHRLTSLVWQRELFAAIARFIR